MFNNWNKKEKPLIGFTGLGGGSTALPFSSSGIGGPYFFANVGGTVDEASYDLAVDKSGNIYVVGYSVPSGSFLSNDAYGLIIKVDKTGSIVWQRLFGASGQSVIFSDIVVDDLGNSYVVGQFGQTGYGFYDGVLVKFNSSGTLQWQKKFSASTLPSSISIDNSANIYLAGYSSGGVSTGAADAYVAKFNSSGTLQWQRIFGYPNDGLGGTGGNDYFNSVYSTGSGDVYCVGTSQGYAPAWRQAGIISKYNTSGTFQWARYMYSGTPADAWLDVCGDSNGDVIVVGRISSSTTSYFAIAFVAKYNSSGTLQWQRTLDENPSTEVSADDCWFTGVTVDSNNNIYCFGHANSSADALLVKYNSSGTLQWQRLINGTNSTSDFNNNVQYGQNMAIDRSNNLYLSIYHRENSTDLADFAFAKLPNDGSGTGTHGVWVYSTISFTSSATSFTSANASLMIDAAASASTSNATYSSSTPSKSVTINQI